MTDTNLRHLSETQCAILESFGCFVDGSELSRKILQTKGTFDILGLKRAKKYCFLKLTEVHTSNFAGNSWQFLSTSKRVRNLTFGCSRRLEIFALKAQSSYWCIIYRKRIYLCGTRHFRIRNLSLHFSITAGECREPWCWFHLYSPVEALNYSPQRRLPVSCNINLFTNLDMCFCAQCMQSRKFWISYNHKHAFEHMVNNSTATNSKIAEYLSPTRLARRFLE